MYLLDAEHLLMAGSLSAEMQLDWACSCAWDRWIPSVHRPRTQSLPRLTSHSSYSSQAAQLVGGGRGRGRRDTGQGQTAAPKNVSRAQHARHHRQGEKHAEHKQKHFDTSTQWCLTLTERIITVEYTSLRHQATGCAPLRLNMSGTYKRSTHADS